MVFDSSSGSKFKEQEYAEFRTFLERNCGILLGENKNYLIDSRLRKIIRDCKFDSLQDLIRKIQGFGNESLKQSVIDAMTTNETLWFRDRHPFEYFKNQLLDEISKSTDPNPKIWCAASSSGQEPYSISICVEEQRKIKPGTRDIKILATDISRTILDQAKNGAYDSLALNRGMSSDRLQQHFVALDSKQWQVKPNIKQRIEFRQYNLKDNFTALGRFDVVFCRNVLIYFSAELQNDILRKIHGVLKPGGYLFLGGSETPRGLNELFSVKYYSPGVVYQKLA
ncbi:MAG: protein-glutamate O-methyltransferase CheR [Pseudomonadales bacterium]|nr:protein-glutamate O-methyltransferase CheR [Pseudomonadales bacterium]